MKTEEQAALFQFKWSNIQIRVWEVIATYVNKLIQNSSTTQTLIFTFFLIFDNSKDLIFTKNWIFGLKVAHILKFQQIWFWKYCLEFRWIFQTLYSVSYQDCPFRIVKIWILSKFNPLKISISVNFRIKNWCKSLFWHILKSDYFNVNQFWEAKISKLVKNRS